MRPESFWTIRKPGFKRKSTVEFHVFFDVCEHFLALDGGLEEGAGAEPVLGVDGGAVVGVVDGSVSDGVGPEFSFVVGHGPLWGGDDAVLDGLLEGELAVADEFAEGSAEGESFSDGVGDHFIILGCDSNLKDIMGCAFDIR